MESTDNKPGYTLGRGYNPSVSRLGSDLPPHVRFKNTKMKPTLALLQFMKILHCNHLHTDTQHNTNKQACCSHNRESTTLLQGDNMVVMTIFYIQLADRRPFYTPSSWSEGNIRLFFLNFCYQLIDHFFTRPASYLPMFNNSLSKNWLM